MQNHPYRGFGQYKPYGKGKPVGDWAAKNKHCRPVQRLDLEGNVLQTYKSIYDAKTCTALGYAGIRDCVKGIRKDFAGFKWRFVTTTLSGLSGEDNQQKE